MAQIDDLIDAYKLGALTGLDTSYGGGRDVNLKDPLVYDTYSAEDEPLPDDLIYVTRGEGLRKKEYVGNKGRDELNFLQKIGLGIVDAMTDNKFDWDRANLVPKDEYNQKRLAESRRKADLGGDAVPSPDETRKRLETERVQDDYLFERLKKLNDYELTRFKDTYPQYAKMINDEIYKRVMQAQYNRPDLVQGRMG